MKKLSLLLLIPLAISCEKALLDDNPANNPQSNFDILWQNVADKYSFFELKGINWDSIYTYYDPMVEDGISDHGFYNVLDSMLFDLRDGHVNLISPFNVSRNWEWYLKYPDNFDFEVMERNYLGEDYLMTGGFKYTIIDSVGYIYYGSFSNGFSLENINAVMSYMKGTKGLIVDVRSNGGGIADNALVLAQRLVQVEKTSLITLEKTGPGPDDFGNALSYTVGPSDGVNYHGPVAVLINRRCYSATNTFAAIMWNYDNVTLIGDKTGGGGGIPIDNELPNGWRYRFSATVSLIPIGDTAYYNIELGIPPDISVANTALEEAAGIDRILETALDLYR